MLLEGFHDFVFFMISLSENLKIDLIIYQVRSAHGTKVLRGAPLRRHCVEDHHAVDETVRLVSYKISYNFLIP